MVQGKNTTDLLKTYGPDKDTLLMTLCCYKNDSPSLRAQIYAFISRVLEEANEAGIGKYMKNVLSIVLSTFLLLNQSVLYTFSHRNDHS